MGKRIFASYNHEQGEWVWKRLVPCLEAGGAEVFIDKERFQAGKGVAGQMDAWQDRAEVSILVLSPEYLSSPYCRHEMDRAIACDPDFERGCVVPVLRAPCVLPGAIKRPNPLYADLTNDADPAPWDLVLQACDADLGAAAPEWLRARDDVARFLERSQSVNLIVTGNPRWSQLVEHIRRDFEPDLAVVDLDRGTTASRRGLVSEILTACGATGGVPPEPEDLAEFDRVLSARRISKLALLHFDHVQHRAYGIDLFSAMRALMDSRRLVLLVQSRTPFAALLPRDHPLSPVNLETVELHGRER